MNDLNENKPASFDPSPNTEFLREKIKAKPINKKKLLRRTFFTVLTAAIFGAVACLTFFVLEPFISERINKTNDDVETTAQTISFSDMGEDDNEEILPEDMYANDTEMIEEALQGNVSEVNQNIQDIENMIQSMEFGVADYQKLYAQLRVVSESVSYSMVNIVAVTAEKDLLNNAYEQSEQTSGVIVADNGPAFLILAKDKGLTTADELQAIFWDGTSSVCNLIGKDDKSGLIILSVNRNTLSGSTLNNAKPAILGTSKTINLKGTPVMALGTLAGISDSVSYGMITSSAQEIPVVDANYKYLYTDIQGLSNASGVIANLRGGVIGFIDNSYDSNAEGIFVKAIGISELKPLIEKISNSEDKAYLGIQGTDITDAMEDRFDLPEGIYINQVEMDSPAMIAGLQNGDILVSIDGVKYESYQGVINWLYDAEPATEVQLSVMRQSVDTYVPITINVTLGTTQYLDKEEQ